MLFRGAKCFKTLYIQRNTNLSKRARTLHQQEKKKININKLVMHDGSQLTLIVQVYFPFTREW